LKDNILLDKITKKLKTISDIDNILTKLALNRVIPRDLINLKKSLISIIDIYELIKVSENKRLIKILKI
jgi:DNA mismatch repair protein MutS